MMRGSITRRGALVAPQIRCRACRRRAPIRYVTVRGTRKEAEAELARLVNEVNTGTLVDPSKITVGEWLHKWLTKQKLSPKSEEAYQTTISQARRRHRRVKLQKLRPVHVHDMQLLKRDGSPVARRTEQQTRRVLKSALQSAVDVELVSRNVAASGSRVTGEDAEVRILRPAEIAAVLEALRDFRPLSHCVCLHLATGMRRGELLALRWQDVDLKSGS